MIQFIESGEISARGKAKTQPSMPVTFYPSDGTALKTDDCIKDITT